MSTVLGKEEKLIKEDTFTANLILFWLKANYNLTNKRVTGSTPNTLLGIIPLGKAQVAQPLKTIASVAASTDFHFKRLIIGLVLLFAGLAIMGNSFVIGVVVAILGAINILNCYTATFAITNNAGQTQGYEISILEKSKVETFVDQVNTIIAEV